MAAKALNAPDWRLTPYGAFGSLLPTIVSMANKTDAFTFPASARELAVTAIYIVAAAILTAIFPFGRRATPFNAALVGILFPSIVGSASSIAKHALIEPALLNLNQAA